MEKELGKKELPKDKGEESQLSLSIATSDLSNRDYLRITANSEKETKNSRPNESGRSIKENIERMASSSENRQDSKCYT